MRNQLAILCSTLLLLWGLPAVGQTECVHFDGAITETRGVLSLPENPNFKDVTYQWLKVLSPTESKPIVGAVARTFAPKDYGTYRVHVVLESEDFVLELPELANSTVAPNPNDGNFTVHLTSQNNEESWRIYVYNPMGKRVYSRFIGAAVDEKIEIHLAELPAGIYYVHVANIKASFTHKICKQS